MKIKRLAQIACSFLLLISIVLPQPIYAAIQQDWTIDGDTVYIDDSNVYIAATPHTITSSGWVEFELRSKGYEGEIDAVWGFDIQGDIIPSQPQIWREDVAHQEYRMVDVEIENTLAITDITDFTKLLWTEFEGEPDIGNRYPSNLKLYSITGVFESGGIPEEENEVQTLVVAFNSHTLDDDTGTVTYNYITQEREYYTEYYDDWVKFSIGNFNRVYYPYKGCNDWHFTRLDVSIQANVTYKVRCWVEVPFNDGKQVEGKYVWGIKPSGETLREAIVSGHLYLLDPWYDSSWTYRETITIDHTEVDGDLEYFPVYIDDHDLSATFWAEVQVDGGDIVITSDDKTTKLRRELVSIDTGGETIELHVRVPDLSDSEDTILYIYYGNAGATEANSTDTWNANFMAVYHMDDDPDNTHITDSTSYSNNGTKGEANDPLEVAGYVGKAQQVTPYDSNTKITVADADSLDFGTDSFTVEFSYIMHNDTNGDILGKYNYPDSGKWGCASNLPTGLRWYYNSGALHWVVADMTSWSHITFVINRDEEKVHLYQGGSLISSQDFTPQSYTNAVNLTLGGFTSDQWGEAGCKLDNVRLSNILRTTEWISTTNNTLSSPATFYSIGALVTLTNPTMGNPVNPAVDSTSVTISGSITDTGYPDDDDCSEYGFVWDSTTHANPGDIAPDATDYTFYWSETGDFSVGTFSHIITGLTELTSYCFRAYALGAGYTYSDEICFFIGEEGKVYLEIRPDLDETFIRGQAGVPTDASVGEFNGYSLPIYNDNFEELHYIMCVPDRWDGISDILIHIDSALAAANQSGLAYNWELLWEHFSPNEDVVPATANTITKERTVYSDIQYESYQDWLVIDYNIDVGDAIEADDLIAITLRRTDAKAQNDTDEIIVFAIDILFARGDFLADPEGNTNIYITNFAVLTGWIGDADMVFFALIFLCLGLMIAGYALHKSSLAFLAISAWMALLVYCRIESAGEWGIYMAIFWLCFAGIIVCGIEGVFLNKGEEAAEDEAEYTSEIDQAYKDMDLDIESRRARRREDR